jgi:F-type H+-transporting ATPase subunit delta
VAGTRDIAGRRYALAIMDIARADGAYEAWSDALDGLEALTSSAAYIAALQSDGMTDEKYQTIVRQVVPNINQKQLNLFRLLRRKNRLELGASIASYYRELWDDERQLARAVVTTAVEMDDERREQIRALLARQTGKNIVIETNVDPSIIGGATIRIGDRMLDGSARSRLRRLREQLEAGW